MKEDIFWTYNNKSQSIEIEEVKFLRFLCKNGFYSYSQSGDFVSENDFIKKDGNII
jgi:hypothetical protein